jgi:RNA polymerase sigma-70 factor, ECF subfamily
MFLRVPLGGTAQQGLCVHVMAETNAQPPGIDEIFAAHHRQVSVWVRRLGGPDIEVDDAVQEVFVIALRRLHRFKGKERMIVWLYRITENVVRLQRRSSFRRRRMLSDRMTAHDQRAAQVPSPEPLPPEQLAKTEALRLIYQVLDKMSERSRTMFVLFELERLSGQEIAEFQGARVATVRVWLHRARAEFRRYLRDFRPAGAEAREPIS